jgi:hypothetical protein
MKAALPALRYDSINDGGPTVIVAFLSCEWTLHTLQAIEPGDFQDLRECIECLEQEPAGSLLR